MGHGNDYNLIVHTDPSRWGDTWEIWCPLANVAKWVAQHADARNGKERRLELFHGVRPVWQGLCWDYRHDEIRAQEEVR